MKAMKSKRRGNEKEKRTIKKIRNYLEKRSGRKEELRGRRGEKGKKK